MKNPKLSIIVPVYNGEQYIDGLLNRLARQADDALELIFVNDGSSDESYIRLKEWQEHAGLSMIVHHQENKGVSAARNAGVELAKGEYITFVDVDDGISDDYVRTLLDWTDREQDVLVFQTARVFGETVPVSRDETATEQITGYEMLCRFLLRPTNYGVYNLLLKQDYIRSIHARFPAGYKYYEDYDYLIHVFAQTDKITVLSRVLYYYILRDGSAMGKFSADRIFCLKLMEDRADWLESTLPEFAPRFRKWGIPRLYWSVLWQAALSLKTYREFAAFAERTRAKCYLENLTDYPSRLVRLSTAGFMLSGRVYWLAVRLTGHGRSRVTRISLEELDDLWKAEHFYY